MRIMHIVTSKNSMSRTIELMYINSVFIKVNVVYLFFDINVDYRNERPCRVDLNFIIGPVSRCNNKTKHVEQNTLFYRNYS